VPSTARAQVAATSRANKAARAKDDLDRLARSLGTRFYPDEQAVTSRAKKIASDRKAGPYLCSTAGTDPGTGKPTLAWHFDQAVIDAEAATDDWYALTANLGTQVTAAEVLLCYKGQEAVERRYSHLKGPLAVAPLFLKNNRRIAALITVISLALLIFCLIEREARRNLAPKTKVDGLYNRQPARPTGAAHPGRPGHRAPYPRDRHHAGANHQAHACPGPAAQVPRRGPDPPAMTT
jgi:hypothetical protein